MVILNFTRYRHFISIIGLSFGLRFFDIWDGHNHRQLNYSKTLQSHIIMLE
jgi:hypothetical protein